MFLNLKRTLFLVGSSALLFSACGDDGGGATFDAAVAIDAAGPDAMPDPTFSGTVSLAEVTITNDEAAALGGLSGAAAVISFTAPDDIVPPDPAFDNNVGECKVTIVTIATKDEQGSEGGPVSVTGTLSGEFGCAYNSTEDKYLCSTTDAAAAGVLPMAGTELNRNVGQLAGTMTLVAPGADFSNISYRGMNVILAGFIAEEGNGRFAVLASAATPTLGAGLADDELLLANSLELAANTTLAADSGYQTLVGAGPIPGGFDFLDDADGAPIVMTKAAITDAPALASTLKANGDGFALLDAPASEVAHEFPESGDATFACADGDTPPTVDTCGFTDDTNVLNGIVVFGETTDGTFLLPSALPSAFTEMPDPITQYARFQCSGIGQKSITIPAAAVALINSTGHTRIQTSVTFVNAEIAGKTNVVVGHGVLGFTDAQ
jgi:hypothetical protein